MLQDKQWQRGLILPFRRNDTHLTGHRGGKQKKKEFFWEQLRSSGEMKEAEKKEWERR